MTLSLMKILKLGRSARVLIGLIFSEFTKNSVISRISNRFWSEFYVISADILKGNSFGSLFNSQH